MGHVIHRDDTPSDEDTSRKDRDTGTARIGDPDGSAEKASGVPDLDKILGLDVEVTVVLCEKRLPLKDVALLHTGAMIEFDKNAGEPLVLSIGGRPLGTGKAIKVEENFGLRVFEIGKPEEIVRKLGKKE